MITRLPFTLAPLPGEPFGLWWHTYAIRLGIPRTDLARATGIPVGTPPAPEHCAQIAAASGLPVAQVADLFATARPCPPRFVLLLWTPQSTSRFCPACLADGAPMQPAWSLPLTFHCLTHNQALRTRCPACGQTPPRILAPSTNSHTRCCPRCGHDLAVSTSRTDPLDLGAAAAQARINHLLATMRDPAQTPDGRGQAQDDLTDLILVALHLSQDTVADRRAFTLRLLDGATFAEAVRLLSPPGRGRSDRLAQLVAQRTRGELIRAVPFSWRAASPALVTRIARARDAVIKPIERIRHTTTLPAPAPRRRGLTDPAPNRARRLPDQLWPVWAIRLTDDDLVNNDSFRSAMVAALLLPHSTLPFSELSSLLPHQLSVFQIGGQLNRLVRTPNGQVALRILTELGLALDDATIPIDYARRRRLAAQTELIDPPTWSKLCRRSGLRTGEVRRFNLARCYLYEQITAGSLPTAPHPYRLATGQPRADYAEFCACMPTHLANALTRHAEDLLAAAGIRAEPLSWHPPADWVSVTAWPGADPESTDPAPIHQALARQWASGTYNHWAPTQATADALGISTSHLRQVLRIHPITQVPYSQRRWPGAIVAAPPGRSGHHAGPHTYDDSNRLFHVDPDWLREQYITWHRSMNDIANEIGCRPRTLRAFAQLHDIPLRPRGGGNGITAGTITSNPADLPDPLRNAIRGRHARIRLQRFLALTTYPSICQTAANTGTHTSVLINHLRILENACGGPLFQRQLPPLPIGPLTPLGEQLCHQAREYLALTPRT